MQTQANQTVKIDFELTLAEQAEETFWAANPQATEEDWMVWMAGRRSTEAEELIAWEIGTGL
jgi:hypothetical protein